MSKTIQVHVDERLKDSVDQLFASLGLDTSTAIRMFLVTSVEAGGIPFAVRKESWEECDQRIFDSIARQKAGECFIPAEESLANMRTALEQDRQDRRQGTGKSLV